jgi:hypothetical protein
VTEPIPFPPIYKNICSHLDSTLYVPGGASICNFSVLFVCNSDYCYAHDVVIIFF